ncbi:hypothetical protein A0257_12600 [Hymenobacter psoromatis]|nr:hypothetical protein A0257_12600 [Hymenobacter psoromatis]
MSKEIAMLVVVAITVSCLHTFTGPDHYVPFIALSRTRHWSALKTVFVTIVCGIGHVGSSVLLGMLGVGLGWSLSKIGGLEAVRGGAAGWAMLIFGLAYTAWGLRQAQLNNPHKHFDAYDDGSVYVFEHKYGDVVLPQDRRKVTPWVLFVIFLLGPCEPLIPMLTFPAAKGSTAGVVILVSVFTFFTLVTMVVMVMLGYYGYAFLKTDKLERYVHALGGGTILICGIGMVFLQW